MRHPRGFHSLALIEPILQHEGFVYTFGLLYLLVNIVFFLFGAAPEWHHFEGSSLFMRMVVASARGGGALLNINSALIVLVASRVFMTVLRRTPLNMVLPFDKAMPNFHAYVGTTITFATLIHTVSHLINYGVSESDKTGLHGHLSLAITGGILCVVVLVLRMTTFRAVRSVISFEAFYITHIIGFVTFFSCVILHGSNHGRFSTYKFVTGPLVLYFIDVLLRRFRNRGKSIVVPGVTATIFGTHIIRLELPRNFTYLPGQYCYLNIPAISRYQWHPFSIASSPHENHLVFYIKCDGDWTRALYRMADIQGTPLHTIDVYVRGPFGAPAQHVGQYEHVILISGGVGATPFTAVTKFANNWIMNHTSYGYQSASSAYAAYERNFSIRSAMVPNGFSWNPVSPRALLNSQALGDNVLDGNSDPFSEHLTSASDRAFMSLRQTREGQLGDRPIPRPFSSLRQVRLGNSGSGSSSRDPSRRRPSSLPSALPVDYNPRLGDPTAPIPLRDGEPHPERDIPAEFRSSDADRNMDLPRSARFDVQEEGNVGDEDGYVAAAALEAEIMFKQQNTASNRLHSIGINYAPNNVSVHIPIYEEDSRQISQGISDINSEAEKAAVSWQEKWLIYMHSVTINWVLLWIMMTRFALAGMGRITYGFSLRQRGLSVYLNDTLNTLDLILSLVLFLPVLATVVIEIATFGFPTFFRKNVGNGFDLLIVTPLTFLCVLLHILGIARVGEDVPHVSKLTVFVIWPVLSIFLLWRIIRTIGDRVALAQYMSSEISRTKSLDFIWVGKTPEDDSWIVNELLPITFSRAVRIHRFITQAKESVEPWMQDYPELPLKTTYDRPKWEQVFGNVVEKSKSGSVIGVFFCGPPKMAHVVQLAAMKAMQKSVQNAFERRFDGGAQGSRLSTGTGTNRLVEGSGSMRNGADEADANFETRSWAQSAQGEISGAAAYGCNVRISVRIENFS